MTAPMTTLRFRFLAHSLLVSAVLLATAPLLRAQDDEKPPQVPPARLARTLADLDAEVTKDAPAPAAARALRRASAVVHPDVIARIDALGLRHADLEVRSAAIRALGRMDHPAALKALHETARRDEKLLEKEALLHAELLKEIGRHADPTSIEVLVDDLFESPSRDVVTARILGLGRIRSKKSVDELLRLMRSAKPARVGPAMGDFRLALVALTGVDQGPEATAWINWYGDAQRTLEVSEQPAPLPPRHRKRWTAYWGETEPGDEKEGGGRRRDRKGR